MSFEIIWARIQEETGIKSQYDLASKIGLSQPVISKYKNKNTFPVEWA
ncbi:MAG: helix-turn-helix domain containing protein, partial [Proteobacteria bacterium]|nr:helix-turn-helix domain containing protein [Pseudomonadota bacterium]